MKKQENKPYFADAKVGDKVKCIIMGDGEIIGIHNDDEDYPLIIIIHEKSPFKARYTINGQYYRDVNQSLFYENDFPVIITDKEEKEAYRLYNAISLQTITQYAEKEFITVEEAFKRAYRKEIEIELINETFYIKK